jgi:hypothetical protein
MRTLHNVPSIQPSVLVQEFRLVNSLIARHDCANAIPPLDRSTNTVPESVEYTESWESSDPER